MIIQGDCIEKMKELEENSVDAIVTDPPYGLEFMGKKWDKFPLKDRGGRLTGSGNPTDARGFGKNVAYGNSQDASNNLQYFCNQWARECLRILKPGGFLLSFGGTRTYHRMACGIEDAGFEIRDCIQWLYGSGFPKSLNVGKAVDKLQGNDREFIGIKENYHNKKGKDGFMVNTERIDLDITKGQSEWEGWGTALKPANEPIVVARKPLSEKNVALNVLKWGTGGINIDACRIGTEILKEHKSGNIPNDRGKWGLKEGYVMNERQGRFPANIILDEEAGQMLDEQSGISISSGGRIGKKDKSNIDFGLSGNYKKGNPGLGDKGGASRFFYCAKASKSERNKGCEELEEKKQDLSRKEGNPGGDNPRNRGVHLRKNNHPTVKPIKLMEYLVKLVSRKGATILDPFLGSGTTGIASIKLGRKFIGIEKEEEYIKIAKARIKPYIEQRRL